jgi:hypothetical protein
MSSSLCREFDVATLLGGEEQRDDIPMAYWMVTDRLPFVRIEWLPINTRRSLERW